MQSKGIRCSGIFVAFAALTLALWLVFHDKKIQVNGKERVSENQNTRATSASSKLGFGGDPIEQEAPNAFVTHFTMERLSEEHDRVPTAEDWKELTRILLYSEPSDLVEAVKARFSVHAGITELNDLVEAYENPLNDDTRQRIIEIFSTLQSYDFAEVARRILNDPNRPITDNLLCASALSLVRLGQPEDIQSIYQRINAEGEDPEPAGSLFSDADGLMYAVSEACSPELEQLLMDAAAGRGIATTGRARYVAAAALGNYRSVAVTELLYNLSKNETNAQVRKQAERSLKAIQTPE